MLFYMLRYFKTTVSFSLYEGNIRKLFKNNTIRHYVSHNLKDTLIPESHICPLGRDASLIIALYLILRIYYLCNNYEWNWCLNKNMIFLVLVISLVNMNAVIYLLPFYIIEFFIIYSNKK